MFRPPPSSTLFPYTTLFRSVWYGDFFSPAAGAVWGFLAEHSGWTVGAALSPLFAALVLGDRKSTRLNSSHTVISYAVFCLKKKKSRRRARRRSTDRQWTHTT